MIVGDASRAFCAMLLAICAACSPAVARSEAPIGAMRVCIRHSPETGFVLTARAARGCLSSSCAGFVRSTLAVTVEGHQIALTGDLIHRSSDGMRVCTTDCNGARTVELPLPSLEAGVYSIRHDTSTPVGIDVDGSQEESCVTLD